MLKKFTLFTFLLFNTSKIYANPSPLGIELNKTNLNDVKKSFRILKSEVNATNGYHNNFLDVKDISMDTLSEVNVISNEKNIIEAVSLTLDKKKFDEINQTLSEKYKLFTSDVPFVGDKIAIYEDGDCHVINHAPHMSFTMTIVYTTKKLESKYHDRANKEQKVKREQIKGML